MNIPAVNLEGVGEPWGLNSPALQHMIRQGLQCDCHFPHQHSMPCSVNTAGPDAPLGSARLGSARCCCCCRCWLSCFPFFCGCVNTEAQLRVGRGGRIIRIRLLVYNWFIVRLHRLLCFGCIFNEILPPPFKLSYGFIS